jgi:hypothetical protein
LTRRAFVAAALSASRRRKQIRDRCGAQYTLPQAESEAMFKSELTEWGHTVNTLGLSVE